MSAHDTTSSGGSRCRAWKRRLSAEGGAAVEIALALGLLVVFNCISYRHFARFDVTRMSCLKLSDKTRSLLAGLESDVRIIAFFQKGHALYEHVKNLLREYEYADMTDNRPHLKIAMVDPLREIGRARLLAEQFHIDTQREPNVIVVECAGRRKYVGVRELVEETVDYSAAAAGKPLTRQITAYTAEQALSSAILSVVQAAAPVVYFVGGHGEGSPGEFSDGSGYGLLCRWIRRDDVEVRPLVLAQAGRIPADCSALVIAGPHTSLPEAEVDLLRDYANKSGRLFIMLDPGGPFGLERLLEEWGVKLPMAYVAASAQAGLFFTEGEIVIAPCGSHPIAQSLKNQAVVLRMPRWVEPAGAGTNAAPAFDKPRVFTLAAAAGPGQVWAETDFLQRPARFDESADRRGPIPVAVAVERGRGGSNGLGVKPSRMVVVGDSSFVANVALKRGIGANKDFFLSALNWLLEREALVAVGPRQPRILRLDMNRRQTIWAFGAVCCAMPGLLAVAGLVVAVRRRR